MAAANRNDRMAGIEEFALGFPGAWHDTPWGDSVVKVGTKIFVFLGDPGHAAITVKLPESRDHALSFDGAAPSAYGLGRAGWVTIPVDSVPTPDVDVLHDFVDESYRAVAPKRLVKQLDSPSGPPAG